MPLVPVEELEQLLKGRVLDLDGRAVLFFNRMAQEQPAVQVGDVPQQAPGFRRALARLAGEALEKQRTQKVPVEAAGALPAFQPPAQVIRIAIQEALALDKIDEHQAVEHHRDVPALHVFDRDAAQETAKAAVFVAEAVVELARQAADIEGRLHPPADIDDGQVFFIRQADRQAFQLLHQRFAVLAAVEFVLPAGGGPPDLALDPLPDLLVLRRVGIEYQVFAEGFGGLRVDLAPHGVGWDGAIRPRGAAQRHETALFGNRLQMVNHAIDGDIQALARRLPAQFFDEQGFKIKTFQRVQRAVFSARDLDHGCLTPKNK